MRAVNLIPADARVGGGSGAGGRSGGAVYALLGGLTALVVMAAVWALTSSGIADKRTELAAVQQDVAQAQASAGANAAPGAVQQMRATRTATVRALAEQRVDWAATLDALSRTLPADTTLSGLDATSTPTVGAPTATPGAIAAGPEVKLKGCAPSQRAVALLMPRLRTIPGVTSVQLESSVVDSKAAAATGGTASATTITCRGANFALAVSLEGPPAAAPAPVAGAAVAPAAPAAAATPAAATTAVPGTPSPAPGSGG